MQTTKFELSFNENNLRIPISIRCLLIVLMYYGSAVAQTHQNYEEESESLLRSSILSLVDQRHLDKSKFTRALKHRSVALREATLIGLGRIGGEDILALIEPFFIHNNSRLRKAATFAAGLSNFDGVNETLWELLKNEKDESVKQEIYLSIGNLGGKKVVPRLLSQVQLESNLKTKSSVLQALAFAFTYVENANIQLENTEVMLDIDYLVKLFKENNQASYSAFYFLARINNVKQLISPSQLQELITIELSPANQVMLARLIGKTTKIEHPGNRELLSWLIAKSDSNNVALASESIIAMEDLLYIPQARIQLGKLHASRNPLIAQMALQVLAKSSLQGMQIVGLLKKALKSERASMVIAAVSGLVKRQSKDEMTWAVKILAHKDPFIRLNFAKIIADKNKEEFRELLTFQSKDPDRMVSNYVRELLEDKNIPPIELSANKIDYSDTLSAPATNVLLNTTAGKITIKMDAQALFSAASFIHLVNTGYYNGTYFSRMIGNFVAQGGDNIGNQEGGSLSMFSEEISYASHTSGTIGMATAGKDTANGQFFINIGDNIHLDRHYTVFAHVIEGMETVLKLSNGDKIITAEIVD